MGYKEKTFHGGGIDILWNNSLWMLDQLDRITYNIMLAGCTPFYIVTITGCGSIVMQYDTVTFTDQCFLVVCYSENYRV